MLINLQPYARPMAVAVFIGGRRRSAGSARDTAEKRVDMHASLRTLAALETEGLFRERCRALWPFEMRYRSAGEWQAFVEKPNCGGIDVDSALLEAAFAEPDGYVATVEEDLAVVYAA